MEEIPQLKVSKKPPGKNEGKVQRLIQGPEETEAIYSGTRAAAGIRAFENGHVWGIGFPTLPLCVLDTKQASKPIVILDVEKTSKRW